MVSAQRQAGFTYLALIFLVAVLGAVAASAAVLWSTASQRDREARLLFVGEQYRSAIMAYYEHTPGAVKRFPRRLEDLLADSRQAGMVRYLRKIYLDPMTDSADWGVVRAPDGGVMGVFSKSGKTPIKRAHFQTRNVDFESAATYSDWRFQFVPAR